MGRRVDKRKKNKIFSKIFRKNDNSTTIPEKLVLGVIALIITFIIVSTGIWNFCFNEGRK